MDRHGRDVLMVLARLTYVVSPKGVVTLAERQRGLRVEDVPETDAPSSSVRYPGDLFDHKPGTDVLLVGNAHPPAECSVMDVSLTVAARRPLKKTVRVHGPRVFQDTLLGIRPGAAAVLAQTPLRYELAYGGSDLTDPQRPIVELRNPVGTGVPPRVGHSAPQLEDPDHPLSSRDPAPAAFAPIASWWKPRSDLAGTYDEDWARLRAPIRPVDFDPRHHSVAPPDLWSEEPLSGEEWVEAIGVRPEGPWRFRVPAYAPAFTSVIAGRIEEHPTHLDTYLIDADAGTVELSWRAAVALPRHLARVERVHVSELHVDTLEPVLDATVRERRHLPVVG